MPAHLRRLLLLALMLGGLATPAVTQQATGTNTSTGTITGTVLDPSGALIQNAHITLTLLSAEHSSDLSATSDKAGRFSFFAVPPGDFRLTIVSGGFSTLSVSGVLHAGENYDAPELTMLMGVNSSDVNVTIPKEELAQYEVKAEEKQRVLAVIPNFYVTYVPHPVPLNSKQKFELAWRTFADPVSFVGAGASAGIQEAQGLFKGYGTGAEGYGKRYAASFGDGMFGTLIGSAILPSVMRQDPRYFYKGTGTVKSRIWYALAFSVRCKGDNGNWQPAYASILGGVAAGGVSNLYYPKADRNGISLTLENTGFGIAGSAVGNLFQEFLVKRLTPKVPKYVDTP